MPCSGAAFLDLKDRPPWPSWALKNYLESQETPRKRGHKPLFLGSDQTFFKGQKETPGSNHGFSRTKTRLWYFRYFFRPLEFAPLTCGFGGLPRFKTRGFEGGFQIGKWDHASTGFQLEGSLGGFPPMGVLEICSAKRESPPKKTSVQFVSHSTHPGSFPWFFAIPCVSLRFPQALVSFGLLALTAWEALEPVGMHPKTHRPRGQAAHALRFLERFLSTNSRARLQLLLPTYPPTSLPTYLPAYLPSPPHLRLHPPCHLRPPPAEAFGTRSPRRIQGRRRRRVWRSSPPRASDPGPRRTEETETDDSDRLGPKKQKQEGPRKTRPPPCPKLMPVFTLNWWYLLVVPKPTKEGVPGEE